MLRSKLSAALAALAGIGAVSALLAILGAMSLVLATPAFGVGSGGTSCSGTSGADSTSCSQGTGSSDSTKSPKPVLVAGPLGTPDSLEGPIGSPTDADFWLVSPEGGVWSFGDATWYGAPGSLHLTEPVVALAPTADEAGYWALASDGGVFAFGDANYFGSMGGRLLARPVVSMAPTPDGLGYWLVASDGGVFAFGDAPFRGAPVPRLDPAEKIIATQSGSGYWVMEQNGTAYDFGDAIGAPPAQGLVFQDLTPGDEAVSFAFDQLGKPYIWGGTGPAGYDCSGLAQMAWRTAGVSIPRVSTDQYHTAGRVVPMGDLQAGDLVFWAGGDPGDPPVNHTAIYVGGGQIVESTGDHVQLNSFDQWGSDLIMANGRRP